MLADLLKQLLNPKTIQPVMTKSYNKIIILILFSIFMSVGVSCSDDIKIDNGIISSGGSGITLYLPDIEGAAQFGATRSDEFQNTRALSDAEEGGIKSLWFCAYPADNNSELSSKIVKLTENDILNVTNSNDGYKKYEITDFQEGNYRIYVIANFEDYLSGSNLSIDENLKENELRNLILYFSTDKFLKAGNLPMYCLNDKIKAKANGNPVENGIFEVKNNSTIFADLTFLCSKVRYTILFDNTETGFSYPYSSNEIDFTKTKIENIASQTNLLTTEFPIGDPFNDELEDISRVKYPSSDSPYLTKSNNDSSTPPGNLSEITEEWNASTAQRAWQGVLYLPENKNSEKLTKISFEPNKNALEKEYSFDPIEFDRANMYDYIVKITGSTPQDMEFSFNVSDWTMETLSYQLHGPYELIVKDTKMEVVYSGKWTSLCFKSNVPDDEIDFEFPMITVNGESFPFYTAEVIDPREDTDEDGNLYELGKWPSMMRIQVNPEIPFSVLYDLAHSENGYNGIKQDDLNYFHLVAGNIHKKIDIKLLVLDAFLTVTPKVIIIETRSAYMSGNGDYNIPISFHTNYDNNISAIDFYIDDPYGLLKGLGHNQDDLKLSASLGEDEENFLSEEGHISVTSGVINLVVKNIFEGHAFWNEEWEFKIKFVLNVYPPGSQEKEKTLEEEVTIIVKPFSTNYIIHFKDNTKAWDSPHIFVYQDLTLPSDLNGIHHDKDYSLFADQIVGYVEYNTSLGKQYNAAVQYVFSNNIAFRGWDGYGGDSGNDPYANAYRVLTEGDSHFTMGFVIFGEPESNGSWNFEYSYQKENIAHRYKHYRYDVNFNEDHEMSMGFNSSDKWACVDCFNLRPDYNFYVGNDESHEPQDPDGRGYPGISMEKEDNGWWKYTLTGVAQPGKTMLFFANWHEPWNAYKAYGNYVIEDNRYPGDYESGLQLFDYENNEAWFLFDGNGTNTDQHFTNYKPDSRVVNLTTQMINQMKIEIMKPSNGKKITKIEFRDPALVEHREGGGDKYDTNDLENGESPNFDYYNTYKKDYGSITPPSNDWEVSEDGLKYVIRPALNNPRASDMDNAGAFSVRLIFDDDVNDYMEYELAPKNFVWKGNDYITEFPLRFEFEPGMKMLIKWSDNIKMGSTENNQWGWTYQPMNNGCDYMNVYWDYENNNNVGYGMCPASKEIGNYKHVEVTVSNTPSGVTDKSKLYLVLGQSQLTKWSSIGKNFVHTLKIEDMPKFYNPENGMYQINWHMLRPGYYMQYKYF